MPIFHKTRVCNKASLSPINEPFLSFNTNQKPRIKSPKSGDLQNKNYIGRSPDPIFSRPNIKEKIMVWLYARLIVVVSKYLVWLHKTQRELYVNTNAYIKRTLSYRLIVRAYTVRVAGFVMFSYRL